MWGADWYWDELLFPFEELFVLFKFSFDLESLESLGPSCWMALVRPGVLGKEPPENMFSYEFLYDEFRLWREPFREAKLDWVKVLRNSYSTEKVQLSFIYILFELYLNYCFQSFVLLLFCSSLYWQIIITFTSPDI